MPGSASGSSEAFCSPADVRRSLSYLMPYLGPYWDRPLGAYASEVYSVERFHTESTTRVHARSLLRICFERAARRSGYTDKEAQAAGRELLACPVLQTGSHCLLLFEPDAFYTHLFSLMGLMAHSRNWHITYSVSTSSFNERAKKGPGWIRIGGETLNLFGLPRSRMDGGRIGCLNGPYRYALTNAKRQTAPNPSAIRLLAALPDTEFRSAAEAIKAGNHALWDRVFPPSVKLLQLDDFDVADLIADHLENSDSWMATQFVGDGVVAKSILAMLDQLNAGLWAGWVRQSTDFFWRLEEHRVVPLRLVMGRLRADKASCFEVEFIPSRLAAALRTRAILPSLFTAFLVISILPGTRVLGGCRQVVYYPLMRYLTSIGIQQSGDVDLLAAMLADERSGVWGHRVLLRPEPDPLHEMEAAGGVPTLLSSYADLALSRSSGDLESFTRDRMWSRLASAIANGTADRASNERQWFCC